MHNSVIFKNEMHLAMNAMLSSPLPALESPGPFLNVSCEMGFGWIWICPAQLHSLVASTVSTPARQQHLSFKEQGQRGCLPITEAACGEAPSHSWCRAPSELSSCISLWLCSQSQDHCLGSRTPPQIESGVFFNPTVLSKSKINILAYFHNTHVKYFYFI